MNCNLDSTVKEQEERAPHDHISTPACHPCHWRREAFLKVLPFTLCHDHKTKAWLEGGQVMRVMAVQQRALLGGNRGGTPSSSHSMSPLTRVVLTSRIKSGFDFDTLLPSQ